MEEFKRNYFNCRYTTELKMDQDLRYMVLTHSAEYHIYDTDGADVINLILSEAKSRYPIGTKYVSYGRDCIVKGELKLIGKIKGTDISDLSISDGYGGAVFAHGEWSKYNF